MNGTFLTAVLQAAFAFIAWTSATFLLATTSFAVSASSASLRTSTLLPETAPRLPWGDVNLLIVTDVHSWIGGHARHQEHSLWNESVALDLDYGDVLSFYQHLQRHANASQQNLFFVMNGDFTDGTGLTTFPPTRLCQLLETMPWDAINIGNHELYRNLTVAGLDEFIDFWKGRYLTSNVLSSTTHEPLGNRFIFLHGPTAKVLTFGFLYNMTGNCAAAIVEPVQQVIQQSWFERVLTGKTRGPFDAILVLAHMDYLDPLVTDVLLPAIRRHVGPNMPIQFVTGHSHIRGFAQLDSYSTTLEAGRYLDTLGFVSFPIHSTVIQEQSLSKPSNDTTTQQLFQHVMIDANRDTLRSILNRSHFATPDGKAFSKRIHQTQEEMGLLQPLGCSPETYYVDRGLDEDQALWNVYREQVLPLELFSKIQDGNTNLASDTNLNPPILVQGTGAMRYDVFQGLVVVDDIIAVCPYRDVVYQIITSVRGDVLRTILNYNESTIGAQVGLVNASNATRKLFASRLPPYVVAGELPLVDDQVYQLLTVDFDLKYWTQRILNLTGTLATPIPILDAKTNEEVTTTQLWIDFVRTQWSNTSCSNSSTSSDEYNNDNSESNGEAVHKRQEEHNLFNICLWWLGLAMMVLTLVLLSVFLMWRIMCIALWRYRQGYRVPHEKQQQPKSTEKVVATTESLTLCEGDDEEAETTRGR